MRRTIQLVVSPSRCCDRQRRLFILRFKSFFSTVMFIEKFQPRQPWQPDICFILFSLMRIDSKAEILSRPLYSRKVTYTKTKLVPAWRLTRPPGPLQEVTCHVMVSFVKTKTNSNNVPCSKIQVKCGKRPDTISDKRVIKRNTGLTPHNRCG